jgi:ribosomal protein S18 acetylase RimI-like enzyme
MGSSSLCRFKERVANLLYRETNPSESFCAVLSAVDPGPVAIITHAFAKALYYNILLIDLRLKLSESVNSWLYSPTENLPFELEVNYLDNEFMGRRVPETTDDASTSEDITITVLADKLKRSPNNILTAIQSLERRTFPSSECLSIMTEISKRNTQLIYAQSSSSVIGYLVYINTSSGLRIHKVCVAEAFRRQHIATKLIQRVCGLAHKTGKDIDLWVDEGRLPAIQCYVACGFEQAGDVVIDYYGPGRNGVRMVWTENSLG